MPAAERAVGRILSSPRQIAGLEPGKERSGGSSGRLSPWNLLEGVIDRAPITGVRKLSPPDRSMGPKSTMPPSHAPAAVVGAR